MSAADDRSHLMPEKLRLAVFSSDSAGQGLHRKRRFL